MAAGDIQVTIFTDMFNMFDQSVLDTINSGSARIISLVSPLAAAGFGIYVILVMMSYLRGHNDQPVVDFVMKMVGWSVVISLGMNVGLYSEYVVPFFNGLGDALGNAIIGDMTGTTALDTLASAYINGADQVYNNAQGIAPTLAALAVILITFLFGFPFLAIAAAYIILSKFALGLLLALGPVFVICRLFPATVRFFESWVSQCLNYGLLVALYAAAMAIEVKFANSQISKQLSVSASSMSGPSFSWTGLATLALMDIAFIVIALNLPSLASQLAGGIGISSMTGSIAKASRMLSQLAKAGRGGVAAPRSGGSISQA